MLLHPCISWPAIHDNIDSTPIRNTKELFEYKEIHADRPKLLDRVENPQFVVIYTLTHQYTRYTSYYSCSSPRRICVKSFVLSSPTVQRRKEKPLQMQNSRINVYCNKNNERFVVFLVSSWAISAGFVFRSVHKRLDYLLRYGYVVYTWVYS